MQGIVEAVISACYAAFQVQRLRMVQSSTPKPPDSLFEQVQAAFEAVGWAHEAVDERSGEVLRAAFEAEHTRVNLHVQVFDPIRAISVVAEAPLGSDDPARRERLAELSELPGEVGVLLVFEGWRPYTVGAGMYVQSVCEQLGAGRVVIAGLVGDPGNGIEVSESGAAQWRNMVRSLKGCGGVDTVVLKVGE